MVDDSRPEFFRSALLFCILSFFLFAFHLEQISLYHTDEQYYIQSCRNMLASGDWLTPVLNGRERFAKPILFYWLTSLSFKVFGVGLVSARLVSAFLGSVCLWTVFRMGSVLFNARAGLYAVFILASSYLYFLSSRLAYTDMTLCFFITLALFFLARFIASIDREGAGAKRDIFLFYAAAGLATATKGPPGFLLPGITAAAYGLLGGGRGKARHFIQPAGILLFFALSLCWPLAMTWRHGAAFLHHLVYAEGIERIRGGETLSLYFPLVILRYFAPWSLFLLCAGLADFGKNRALLRGREIRRLFLWIAAGVPLVLFTLLGTRHSRYMLPALPALALLVGHSFQRISAGELPSRGFRMVFSLVSGLYGLAACLSLAVLIAASRFLGKAPISFLVPLVFFLGVAGLVYSRKKPDLSLAPLFLAFPLLTAFPLIAGTILPLLNPDPMMPFSRTINHDWRPGTRIGTFRLGNGNQRLRILTGRPVTSIEKDRALVSFLKQKAHLFFALRERDFRRLPEGTFRGLKIAGTGKKWKKLSWKDFRRHSGRLTANSLESFREKMVLVRRE